LTRGGAGQPSILELRRPASGAGAAAVSAIITFAVAILAVSISMRGRLLGAWHYSHVAEHVIQIVVVVEHGIKLVILVTYVPEGISHFHTSKHASEDGLQFGHGH
jgi:hypothetical protein